MHSPTSILLIDDDDSIREFVSVALADEGYEVNTAIHGADGLQMLKRHKPALILLDMRMPVMDGWTFLDYYHQTPGPHAPVIALTASRKTATAQLKMPTQVARCLAKPFDLDELLDLVAKELGAREH
jgi:CheY-like chemotaxis protein